MADTRAASCPSGPSQRAAEHAVQMGSVAELTCAHRASLRGRVEHEHATHTRQAACTPESDSSHQIQSAYATATYLPDCMTNWEAGSAGARSMLIQVQVPAGCDSVRGGSPISSRIRSAVTDAESDDTRASLNGRSIVKPFVAWRLRAGQVTRTDMHLWASS